MRNRRLGPGTAWAGRAVGLVLLAAIGCSKQEELVPDPGVSPFYPGPTAGSPGGPAAAAPAAGRAVNASDRAGTGPRIPDGPLRPEDVERQLRIALRASTKGDAARAIPLLDRILELEPANREALLGRAGIAMEQSQRAASPEERAAALEKAGVLVRTLRRTYEKSNKQELELFARVLYDQLRALTKQGHYDRAAAVLKEVQQAGFEPFDRVEHDPELAALRSSPDYRKAMVEIDAASLARARGKVKDRVARPLDMAFGFNVKGLDDKPLSLDEYKGKVVLVNFWGTWCEPCRKALPGLAQLYYKHRRRGFEVIGLSYEPGAPDPETARKYVQQFVQQSGIPYRCAMGDEATQKMIPSFKGFPTTLLIDRAGKVRVLITENSEDTLPILDDSIEVLLAEPAPPRPPGRPPTPKHPPSHPPTPRRHPSRPPTPRPHPGPHPLPPPRRKGRPGRVNVRRDFKISSGCKPNNRRHFHLLNFSIPGILNPILSQTRSLLASRLDQPFNRRPGDERQIVVTSISNSAKRRESAPFVAQTPLCTPPIRPAGLNPTGAIFALTMSAPRSQSRR